MAGAASCESAVASVVTSVVVCACGVSSSLDEAGVSSAVMSAPWSLGCERCGTGPAAQLLLPLSYAPVGWGRGAVFRGGCLCPLWPGGANLWRC